MRTRRPAIGPRAAGLSQMHLTPSCAKAESEPYLSRRLYDRPDFIRFSPVMRKALRYLAAIFAIAFTHSIQAANPPMLPAKAERLIVSKVVFYDATLEQCVDFLLRESVKIDPDGAGIKLKLGGPKDEATLIRMSMRQGARWGRDQGVGE